MVQGDAYRLRGLLETLVREPAAAMVSGLPLVTKPLRTRLRLIGDAMNLLKPGAPFIQFTYAMMRADPEGAYRHQGRVVRTDLDEPAAGSRLDLPRQVSRGSSAPLPKHHLWHDRTCPAAGEA